MRGLVILVSDGGLEIEGFKKWGSNGEPVPHAGVKLPRNSNLPKFAYTISLPFRSVSFQWVATVAKQNQTLVFFYAATQRGSGPPHSRDF